MPRSRPRRFAQPYPAREAVLWIVKNLTGPWTSPMPFQPVARDVVLNAITPRQTIAFVGDIMPTRHVHVSVDGDVEAFLRAADWLVGNLEGPVVTRPVSWVFMGQAHAPSILELLARLAPPARTVLLCANNHAADYGRAVHERSLAFLRRHGIRCAGDRAHPSVELAPGVSLTAGTAWSNHAQDFLAPLPTRAPAPGIFRILSPHWGYELEAVPRRCQLVQGSRWLHDWDLVVGHHSHTPQPVTAPQVGACRRAIAYSLGNFSFGYDLRHHHHGLMLRVEIGPTAAGPWAVGRLRWARTQVRFEERRAARIVLADPLDICLTGAGDLASGG